MYLPSLNYVTTQFVPLAQMGKIEGKNQDKSGL
jgi:hypothetical protein